MKKINDYHFSYREKDGGIQLILSYKVGNKWRQKSRQGFRTKREANESKSDLLKAAERSASLNVDLENITLRQFFDLFFFPDRVAPLEENTRHKYRNAMKSFGPLADLPIKKITYLDISDFVQQERARNMKTSTINLRLATLKTILTAAVKPYRIIQESPATDYSALPTQRAKRVKALTSEQLTHLLSVLKADYSPYYYAIASIAGLAGLRRSEILALMWSDIDFSAREIRVTKQATVRASRTRADTKKPKTENSVRTVPMSPQLISALKYLQCATPRSIDNRLFAFVNVNDICALNKTIGSLSPGFTLHGLRHTFATLMLKNGANIQTVAALIGDTVQTAMNTYIHYTDDLRKEAAQIVQTAFL